MVLEIINSCLTHNLHNNPHLVYSLLYQREVFEPYRTHPSLMDLIQNIETVSGVHGSDICVDLIVMMCALYFKRLLPSSRPSWRRVAPPLTLPALSWKPLYRHRSLGQGIDFG